METLENYSTKKKSMFDGFETELLMADLVGFENWHRYLKEVMEIQR